MRIQMQEVAQSHSLDQDARFDLGLGYVGGNDRSVANLHLVAAKCGKLWAFFTPESQDIESDETSAEHLRTRNLAPAEAELREWDSQSSLQHVSALRSAMQGIANPRIFIDVSAFPRTMLAVLMDGLRCIAAEGVDVHLTLAYRLAQFTPPPNDPSPPNRRVAPVRASFAGWPRRPGLPVHLIVGMGYERYKAQGAVEYLQPAVLSLFSPVSPIQEFADQVLQRNRLLLDNTPKERIFEYQVLEPAVQIAQLSSMLAALVSSTKPVLLPFGPKIFFAVCLLMSMAYQEVSVWHVSGEENQGSASLLPSEHTAYLHVTLCVTDSLS